MERTRDSALAAVHKLRAEVMKSMQDDKARSLLTEELVTQVFDVAWSHRFDDERADARRTVRDIVADASEGAILEKRA